MRLPAVVLRVAVIAAIASIVVPLSLHAHAYKTAANPAPDSSVDASPDRVVVRFSEEVEPRGSEIRVLDADGQQIPSGESTVNPDDQREMFVELEDELPHGTYTVLWQNVSTVDGHPLQGFFLFAVGEPLEAGAVAPGAEDATAASPVQAVGRWLTLLGIAAIIGGLLFHLVVFGPPLRRVSALSPLGSRLNARRWMVSVGGVALFLIGSVVELAGQAELLGGAPLSAVVTDTAWGSSWLWRMGAWLALVASMVPGLKASRAGSSGNTTDASEHHGLSYGHGSIVVALAAIAAIALTSHVATGTEARDPALINHFLHMTASSVWVGGILFLILTVPIVVKSLTAEQLRSELPGAVNRFWTIAIVSIVTLLFSGLYNAWVQVAAPPAFATPYGETLVVKAILVALLFFAAAADLLWLRPKMRSDDNAPRWLGRIGWSEVAIAALVLLSVGFLASTEPASQAADRLGLLDPARETTFTAEDEGTKVTLSVQPGLVGRNRLIFDLEDSAGNPIDNAEEVAINLANLPDEGVTLDRTGSNVGGGRYVAERVAFTVPGEWRAAVVVRRPGAFDAHMNFEFRVAGETVRAADLLPGVTAWSLLIAQLVIIGGIIATLTYMLKRRKPDR